MTETVERRDGTARRLDLARAAPFAVLALLVTWAAVRNRTQLNPDGIAYLEIARHYLGGRTELAVTGYWGPLLSWLIAPLLSVFDDPLLAARTAMAISAMVFHYGTVRLAAALGLSRRAQIVAAWAPIGPVVVWSAQMITPDLLLGGLVAIGTSLLVAPGWSSSRRRQVAAGLVFGAAYLAKAVALPVSALLVGTVCLLLVASRAARTATLLRAAAVTGGLILVVAAPWIVVLSFKYGGPTFSTTGAIAHAVVGPADVDRFYPTFREFHAPEPGRITSWEDPSRLEYARWSAFGSAGLLRHQARVIWNNASAIVNYLRAFDAIGLCIVAATLAFVTRLPWRREPATERWRWALPLIVCNVAVFLPVFAYSERYYLAAYGLLVVAALAFCDSLAPAVTGRPGATSRWPLALAALSIAGAAFPAGIGGWPHTVPTRTGVVEVLAGIEDARCTGARRLASRIAAAGIAGPVAGDGSDALFVAWFLDRPCHGQERDPSADRIVASGARIFVTAHGSATETRLRADARFEAIATDDDPRPRLTAFRVATR